MVTQVLDYFTVPLRLTTLPVDASIIRWGWVKHIKNVACQAENNMRLFKLTIPCLHMLHLYTGKKGYAEMAAWTKAANVLLTLYVRVPKGLHKLVNTRATSVTGGVEIFFEHISGPFMAYAAISSALDMGAQRGVWSECGQRKKSLDAWLRPIGLTLAAASAFWRVRDRYRLMRGLQEFGGEGVKLATFKRNGVVSSLLSGNRYVLDLLLTLGLLEGFVGKATGAGARWKKPIAKSLPAALGVANSFFVLWYPVK